MRNEDDGDLSFGDTDNMRTTHGDVIRRMETASIGTSGLHDLSRKDADWKSVHSIDKAALVWQHMREDSGLSDEADSLYDETGLMGPPWL